MTDGRKLMPDLIYLLAVLACPVGMGVMMLVMMRGNHDKHGNQTSGAPSDEVAQLRAEVESLRAQRSSNAHPADPASTPP
jgi:hypothetical protein